MLEQKTLRQMMHGEANLGQLGAYLWRICLETLMVAMLLSVRVSPKD